METQTQTEIPDYILQRLEYVSKYLKGLTNDWLDVKKQLLSLTHCSYRQLFSRRHKTTKKHVLNDLEKAIIVEWKKITGDDLYLSPEKTHDPNWVQKGPGWFLKERRRKEREQKQAEGND